MNTKKETQIKYKKTRKGEVVKIVNDNTIKVEVERKTAHPLYSRIVKSHKRYLVATKGQEVKVGDIVIIEETKPISKRKAFKLISISK